MGFGPPNQADLLRAEACSY